MVENRSKMEEDKWWKIKSILCLHLVDNNTGYIRELEEAVETNSQPSSSLVAVCDGVNLLEREESYMYEIAVSNTKHTVIEKSALVNGLVFREPLLCCVFSRVGVSSIFN